MENILNTQTSKPVAIPGYSLNTQCITSCERKWWIIDAKRAVLGRLASHIAMLLRGKHKPQFTPNMDNGDSVIVINAEQVGLTKNKRQVKLYHRHTGFIAGLRTTTARDRLEGTQAHKVIVDAVKGMLPKNRLSNRIITNLYAYSGSEHKHAAQNPQVIDFIELNIKNKI